MAQSFHIKISEGTGTGHVQNFTDAFRALAPGNAERCSEEIEVFADAHVVVRAKDVGHVADEALDLPRLGNTVHPRNFGFSTRRSCQTDQDLDGRGLARSIRTDKSKDLSALHGQRKP